MRVGGKLVKPLSIEMLCDGVNECSQHPSNFKDNGYIPVILEDAFFAGDKRS